MVTWMRSALINPGKRDGAIEWALKIRDFVNETFEMNISVHGNVSGPINQIHWVATYDSLAAFEDAARKIVPDEGYNRLLDDSSAADFFNSQSFKDTFFQTLGE